MALDWPDGIHITEQKFIPFYEDEELLTTASGLVQPIQPYEPVWRVRCSFGPSHNDAISTLLDAMYGSKIAVAMPIQKRHVPADGDWVVTGSGFIGADEEYYVTLTPRANIDDPQPRQMVLLGTSLYRITRIDAAGRCILAPGKEPQINPPAVLRAAKQITVRKFPGQNTWGNRNANWNNGMFVDFLEVL